ncbi:hypothetical protein MHU86_20576 [Fragilaria crotonensis]|nr:hypothetical protein MHU86_20576 [Fragilaria crotonensis]
MAVDFYTIPQQITLVFTSLFSGLVSLLGSLTIIYIIWRDRNKKLKCVYHRILFALSLIDCIASLNFAFGFLLVPKGNFWGAQGNTASCEASGFLNTFFVSQNLYNFGLAVYYLLIIRYRKSQEFVARNVEPYIHVLALSMPMGVTFWALFTSSLNPLPFLGGWCSIAKYPTLCNVDEGECSRGLMDKTIAFVMYGLVLLPSFFGIVIIMVMIICHVRGRIAAVVRYRTRPRLDETARQTVVQSMLYIMASLLPNGILVLNHSFNYVFPTHQNSVRFVFACFAKVIVPLQGLFNLIIYIRPRYIALRRQRGESSSFLFLMSEIVVGVQSRPLEADEDQGVDDYAPELAIPDISDKFDGGTSESISGGVDEDHRPSSMQDVEENVYPDTENGNNNVVEFRARDFT